MFRRRQLFILNDKVETYDSADTFEINFLRAVKLDSFIILESTEERKAFKVFFRTFMGYS